MTANPNSWFTFEPSPTATNQLYCFPYAGGGSTVYRKWKHLFPPSIQVIPLQLPGREKRMLETAYTDLSTLVHDFVDTLEPFTDYPYAFFGHSMGALISFEVTRELRRRSLRLPLHLFLSAFRSPELKKPKSLIYHLSDQEFIQKIRELGGTPQELLDNEDFLRTLLPILRADFTLCETYRHQPEPPLNVPFTLFGGSNDSEVSVQEIEPWEHHSSKETSLHIIPGDHFFLLDQPNPIIQTIVRTIHQQIIHMQQ